MEEHKPFTWLGALPYPEHALTAGLVAVLIVGFAALVRPKLAATEAAIEPDDHVSARSFAEVFVEFISGLAEGVLGHGAERYVPLLASFFIFILVANLIGLVPGFTPPTADFNITLALGTVAFVAVVQAFVFTMLSAIYIALAVAHDH